MLAALGTLLVIVVSGIAAWPIPSIESDNLGNAWVRIAARWLVVSLVVDASLHVLVPNLPIWPASPVVGVFFAWNILASWGSQ